jgi:hypothetical protein
MRGASVVGVAVGIVAVAAIATASLTTALAGSAVSRADCTKASTGGFPAFHAAGNVVVGPLAFVGVKRYAAEPLSTRAGAWDKSPALVLPGHTVTVKITGAARRVSGFLGYGKSEGATSLADSRGSVTFVACTHRRSRSRAGGREVTFWSGGFVQPTAPACIPVDVYVDHSRTARRVVISLAAGTCPAS